MAEKAKHPNLANDSKDRINRSTKTSEAKPSAKVESAWCGCIHVGAGFHSFDQEPKHKAVVKRALAILSLTLDNGGAADVAVASAIKSMEDDPTTNAGYGSNLTEDGVVEGDAILSCDDGRFGAVGSITHAKNPILAAAKVLYATTNDTLLGRIQPNFLAGEGAAQYYYSHGGQLLTHDALIEPHALARHQSWHRDLLKAAEYVGAPECIALQTHKDRNQMEEHECHERQTIGHADDISDTVGCIAIDRHGNMACGASSGGVALKKRGRIGPAAINGCGSFIRPAAKNDSDRRRVAVVATGNGEQIAITSASAIAAERLYDLKYRDDMGKLQAQDSAGLVLKSYIENEFIGHAGVRASLPNAIPIVGLVALTSEADDVDFCVAHNSSSFIFGSISSQNPKPRISVSRRASNSSQLSALCMETRLLRRSKIPSVPPDSCFSSGLNTQAQERSKFK